MTEMIEVWINDRWPLKVAKHRAERPVWHHWEAGRLASMWHHLKPTWTTPDMLHGPITCSLGTYWPDSEPREVVYDIGAEEGDFPGLYSSWGCDVVLFEPNDRVWPNIKAIWEANQLRPPLACWDGFAGPHDSTPDGGPLGAYLDDEKWDWPPSAYGPVIGDHGFCNLCERPDIPSMTIDTMVELCGKPPTAITIDVEGAEYEVLYGAAATLYGHRPKVWVSVHPEFARDMYGRADVLTDIRMLMADCGYPLDPESGEMGLFLAYDHEAHHYFDPGPR